MNAAFAHDRLEEHEPHVLRRCCAKRCDVVRRNESHARNERGECGALRRLPRHGQRPERPAVEAPFERDDAWLARRLAGVLERSLDRLGAGVAEERLRAAEAIRETGRQLLRRLRAVEVRRMPEAFELLARGGERRGVAMTEPDDGDPAAEVEILAPRRRPRRARPPRARSSRRRARRSGRSRSSPCNRLSLGRVTRGPRLLRSRRGRRRGRHGRRPCSFGTMPPSNTPAAMQASLRATRLDAIGPRTVHEHARAHRRRRRFVRPRDPLRARRPPRRRSRSAGRPRSARQPGSARRQGPPRSRLAAHGCGSPTSPSSGKQARFEADLVPDQG